MTGVSRAEIRSQGQACSGCSRSLDASSVSGSSSALSRLPRSRCDFHARARRNNQTRGGIEG
eukprot:3909960-Rhodomonas_salina.2